MITEAACWAAYSLSVGVLVGRIFKIRVPIVVCGVIGVIIDRTAVFYWVLLSMLRESSFSAESAGS